MKMLVIHVTGSNVPLVQFPIITHTVDHILVTDHVSYHSPATPPLPPPQPFSFTQKFAGSRCPTFL